MFYKKIIFCLFILFLVQKEAISNVAPQFVDPNLVPQGGMINAHDINTLKELKRQEDVNKDFENFRKRKKQEVKDKDSDNKKREKKSVIKARAEEYATKGVYIENIIISPSEILTEAELRNIVEEYVQTNVTFEQLDNIVKNINKLYLQKGYVTARAYLPEQTIDCNTVKIELIEGRVGNINISGNRWTKSKYIEDRLNLKKGEIFDIVNLEDSLVTFNRYSNGVALKGSLTPGETALGTTDVEVQVNEKLPFHSHFIFDNAGRKTIGEYRLGMILQHDSLTGRRDRLTLGSYASKHSVTPFVDYNIPVNKKDGRVGFNFSYGYSDVAKGPYRLFDINSRSYNYSLYYNQPIIRKPYMELASNTSISYRQATTTFSNVDLYTDKIASLQTGLSYRYDTQRGIWYLNQNIGYAFPFFDKDSNYLKLDGGIVRIHDFGHGIVGQVRGHYQVIPKHIVPYIDQFQLGGGITVRGYNEGLIIGRSGYLISSELMFPIAPATIRSKDKTKRIPFIGSMVKGLVFVDHGAVFPYKGTGAGSMGNDSSDVLLSTGVGLKINLPGDVTTKLSWGFPCIVNRYEPPNHWGRFHFEISLSPDYEMLLKLRKPKKVVEEVL